MFTRRSRVTEALCVLALFSATLAANTSHAAIQFNLDTLSNGTAPAGSPPWLRAVFEQDGTDQVKLTLTSLLSPNGGVYYPSEFISEVAFNFLPSSALAKGTTISGLTITKTSSPNTAAATIVAKEDAESVTSIKKFDIDFQFQTSAGSGRFDGSDVVVYTIKYAGLLESDFGLKNADNTGLYYMAAHIQGIPPDDKSGAVGSLVEITVIPSAVPNAIQTPEPASLAVWSALGFIGMACRRRRMNG